MYYSYLATLATTAAVMGVICYYACVKRPRSSGVLAEWAPLACTLLATVLLTLSPLKSLALSSAMAAYKANGYSKALALVLDVFTSPAIGTRALQVYTFAAYCSMSLAAFIIWRCREPEPDAVDAEGVPEACTS